MASNSSGNAVDHDDIQTPIMSRSNEPGSPNMEFRSNAAPGYEPGIARDGVNKLVLSAYSVGHFANDLCASMWFIYLSYYLVYVV